MKKVLFLIQDHKMPSSRVRVLNLLPELERAGFDLSVLKYPRNFTDKIVAFKTLRKYDIIFLQKKLISPFEIMIVRRLSNKLYFDFDDAIYYRHDSREDIVSRTRYLKFKYITRSMDIVIAGNRFLAEYARQFNRNVVIIPSAVETRNVPEKHHAAAGGKVIIGWVGGNVNLIHLGFLASVFQKLSKEYKIELRVISDNVINIPNVEVKHIPWSLETQEREIALFDIGVMPLPDNKHTEGKCGYKALQYMAAAVPPVVSDVGVNRDIVQHGKSGFVAASTDDFYYAIKTLIEDSELRRRMGTAARKIAEERFSIQVIGKRLAELLMSA